MPCARAACHLSPRVAPTLPARCACCAEYLTGAIEAVSESSGINQAFLGLIVLPIAGNAAEHITVGGWVGGAWGGKAAHTHGTSPPALQYAATCPPAGQR